MNLSCALVGLAGIVLAAAIVTACAAAPPATQPAGWQANPKLLDDLAAKKTGWRYRESEVPAYTLPDPLLGADGARVTTVAQWQEKRRPETLELFRKYVYGRTPARPADLRFEVIARDEQAVDGKAVHKRVRITAADGGKSFAFEASLLVPKNVAPRVPVFLLINNRPVASADPTRKEKNDFWPAEQILARGYATAVFRTGDVDPDKNGAEARAAGVRGVWDGPGKAGEDRWATISAWAWAASRVLDYLQTDPDVDATKVAVVGHSRGGKTALWAGAQDERFALIVSNDSGRGGASLSRRRFGETVAIINKAFPYWFCDNFKRFDNREDELPVDQHQLMALIAPRALYVAAADADLWADPKGMFLALAHASPVYALYGQGGFAPSELPPLDTPIVRDRVAYHVRKGAHNLTPYDWHRFMDFADRLWPR